MKYILFVGIFLGILSLILFVGNLLGQQPLVTPTVHPKKVYNIIINNHNGKIKTFYSCYDYEIISGILKFNRKSDLKEVVLMNVDDILIEEN